MYNVQFTLYNLKTNNNKQPVQKLQNPKIRYNQKPINPRLFGLLLEITLPNCYNSIMQ